MKIISSEERYKSNIFTVSEDHAVDPSGFEIKRSIIHHPGSAVMMAVDPKKRILLVRQYRLAAQKAMWELPAGKLDPGEKPLQAAKRELREETGFSAKVWKKLVEYYPSPGFLAEKMTLYLATNLTEGDPEPMEDERIEKRWFKAKDVDAAIREGKIIDGKTLVGYLMWKRYC